MCEKVNTNELEVQHIPSTSQLAYALTKALPKPRFEHLVGKIGVATRPPICEGILKTHRHFTASTAVAEYCLP